VEPLGHVRVAIRVLGRRFHLDVRHASPALQLIVGVAAQGEPITKPCSRERRK
jgi:hypothetical protein